MTAPTTRAPTERQQRILAAIEAGKHPDALHRHRC
jgi:hypothetical protein